MANNDHPTILLEEITEEEFFALAKAEEQPPETDG